MTTDVIYVTYKNDLSWIVYSIQFLIKHLKGHYGIVVRAEPDCQEIIKDWRLPVRYHYVKPWPDGYAFQMYMKATADQYSEADAILLWDSDHMLLEPVHIESFFQDGKPIIRYRDWHDDPHNPATTVGREKWGPPIERTLGTPLDRDYMVGPPFVFWRDTFAKMRNRVEEVTGLPFYDTVYSGTPYSYQNFLTHPMRFCDYEALGLFASKFESGRYALEHFKATTWPIKVYWSHGDWNPETRADFDRRLAVPIHEAFNGDGFVETEVRRLVQKHGIQTIIETGTYKGTTTEVLARIAPHVYTVEANPEYFKLAGALDRIANVTRVSGDSGQTLRNILSTVSRPVLFYLDAHWETHSPLLEELDAIALNGLKDSVIVIHDFANPNHPEYGFDTWDVGPYELELITEALDKIYGAWGWPYYHNDQAEGQKRGVIYIEPRR